MSLKSNKILRVALLFVLTLASGAGVLSRAQQQQRQSRLNEISAAPFSSSPYVVGEQLTYNVSFANFESAAHIELLIAGYGAYNDGRNGYELRAHVETTGIVGTALYAINNDYTTFVDSSSGLPFRAQQVVREGGNAINLGNNASGAPGTLYANAFAGYDFLSAVYRLRASPLIEGAAYHMIVNNRADQYDTEIRVIGRENVKTSLGSFNTIATEARVLNNPALRDFRLRIYYTDDPKHLPVLMIARLQVGEIRVEIASISMIEPPANTAVQPTQNLQSARPVATAANPPTGAPLGADLPFAVGEQLNYQVYLGNVPQPVASLAYVVRARAKYFGRDGLLLNGTAQTTGPSGRLVAVNDQISSYVDPVTLLPFRTELRLHEGRRQTNATLSIEQDRGNILTERGTRIEIPVGTHDLISVLYALRSFELIPKKRNAVSLLINNRPRTLFVDPVQREIITLGSERIEAIQLALSTDDAQGDKYALKIWVGADRRRLPLRITANTPLGILRADLAVIPVTPR